MVAVVDGAVLALDVGTSSCRASLYDLQAQPIAGPAVHINYTPTLTLDGGADLNADVLFDNVCTLIDRLLTQERLPPVVAVGFSCFWHSLLGVDEGGRPLTPVYLWLDSRARGEMRALRARLDERAIHARTGCVLHWSYWPAKLSWLRHTQPELFSRVKRWISFGELLLQRLTGEIGVSVSMASATGLMDIHTCEWDREMLETVGVDASNLAPLTNTLATTDRWPALNNVPWLPAVGDGACSNVGAGCAMPDCFALMVGTSGAERAVWAPPASFEVPWGVWCYRVDERRVVMGGALNDGGSLLDWLHRTLQLPSTDSAELASMPPDGHGLTILPFWGGERSPGWADDASGALVGLRLSTRPTDILRACLEAVALRFAEIDRSLRRALPEARDVIATGAALLHSPAWMQILADALGRPLLASAEPEASSRGAALLALEALGLLTIDEQTPAVTRRFDPVPEHAERYRVAAERQRRLYHALVRRVP